MFGIPYRKLGVDTKPNPPLMSAPMKTVLILVGRRVGKAV